MKVSTSQMFLSTSSELAKQSGRINELQAKISTGEKLLSASEEPQRAALINQLESTASQISTYKKNLDRVDGRLSIEEAILNSVDNIMGRIRDLSLAGASGTYSPSDKAIVVQEIRGLRDELMSLANSQDSGGNYIFAGKFDETFGEFFYGNLTAGGNFAALKLGGAPPSRPPPAGETLRAAGAEMPRKMGAQTGAKIGAKIPSVPSTSCLCSKC